MAEDDRGTALLIKTQLERQGYQVHAVGNGLEALDILQDERVDLIVTDVVMPEMDGVDLYLALKKDPHLADIPIIIVTDKATFLEAFSALGVNYFLPKSSDIRMLMDMIKKIDSLVPDQKPPFKVLICGENGVVLNQMRVALQSKGYLVVISDNSLEVVNKAIEMTPHLIIVDALMKNHMSVQELVRALRAFDALRRSSIISYVDFDLEGEGIPFAMMDIIEQQIKASLDAGVNKYIGRFNRVTFLDQLKEFSFSA